MNAAAAGPGRRIYIHTYSLRSLARHDQQTALWVTKVLAEIRIARIVQHHLMDQASHLGLLTSKASQQIYSFCCPAWTVEMTQLLRVVGHRPSFPRDRGAFLRVLEEQEEVIISCYDQGYYTFATSEAAAERMFSDSGPISGLSNSLKAGTGPNDLLLICGQCLAIVDMDIGVGRVGRYYAKKITHPQVTDSDLDEIDEHTRSQAIDRAREHLLRIALGLRDSTEQSLIAGCLRSVTVTLAGRRSL
jgi:hypothetical protein